ncbi:MAG: cytochrome c [Deltaproteobacteria bacterium]|nr:cytochrome c [Deltaproteobacteria bacterium]
MTRSVDVREELTEALVALGELRDQWPVGNAEAGVRIYSDACRSCHGADGQGGVGRRLKPNEMVSTSSNAELLHFLLTGRPGTAMRGFAGRLNEQQLADAIAHMRTWQDAPPSP